ncbi:MAG TPA: glucosidase [Candidatus Eisenbacteria bacterium]|nr:glucosidase [Candidatus Eisenbacteria bacterium]
MPPPPQPPEDSGASVHGAERHRLAEDARREKNWKRWGTYLSERQWGTVREDYSADGRCWDYLPHDHARSRAYRWGDDGLLGWCDREGRLHFALALWNGRDPILKERLFGLGGDEGNHGEDVKECWYYLDATPTHSYARALYKYPHAEFPYARLVAENRRRGIEDREYELADTGVFDDNRYFDVTVEYAKASPDDVLVRITAENRGPEPAPLQLLPTLWFRNSWSWGRSGDEYPPRPRLALQGDVLLADHATLGRFQLAAGPAEGAGAPEWLFTDNDTNAERLFGSPNPSPWVKDAFHRHVVQDEPGAVNPAREGTKAAAWYRAQVPAGGRVTLRLRLTAEAEATPAWSAEFDDLFRRRRAEADAWHAGLVRDLTEPAEREVARQATAGLLWSKQFYHYVVAEWLDGDPTQPPPPPERNDGRNTDWRHLHNRDVLSMPDAWEYPWYASWDLAFHVVALARVDPELAKRQLVLFVREWYMHPNGELPAYEWALSDVNPPVHAWAAWRVYKLTATRGERDRLFLERVFQKLLINFTWWVNRKDPDGRNVFAGGFLGLDNVGVFDRSKPLPTGGHLEQADGTAWMAFYCGTMMSIALELASEDAAYEDVASKFFEHFVAISDAMNMLGGTGLWNEQGGFYYDQVHMDGSVLPLELRSMVGLIPLIAVEVLEERVIDKLPGFRRRMQWFLDHRPDLTQCITCMERSAGETVRGHRLLAIPSRERLERVLPVLLDPNEFLSPYGIRSLSRAYLDHPYAFEFDGQRWTVRYAPGESRTGLFGGNSNWRGPVWFPVNFLLIEALERYHHFYGDQLQVECPTGSGRRMSLLGVAQELSRRLGQLFLPGPDGRRPCHGDELRYARDPHWRDLVLFYECFDGDDGRGVGASHQTGWTALAARCLEKSAWARAHGAVERAPDRHGV